MSKEPTKPKKQPRGKPFEKGDVRINRAGVPREQIEFQNALRVAFAEELEKPHPTSLGQDGKPSRSNFQAIISTVVMMATGGHPWAIDMVFDRIGGKVAQKVDLPAGATGFVFDIPRPERERPKERVM